MPTTAAGFGTVVACALGTQQHARLYDAVAGRAMLHTVDRFDELAAWLRSFVGSVDLIALPGHDDTGTDTSRLIRHIVAERPRVAIVAFCQPGSQYSTDLRRLAAAGAHEFVFNGIHDTGFALRCILQQARRACAADCVMQQLAPFVPSALHPLVEQTLAHPDRVGSVDQLADALGIHRKTLFNRCERAAFLPPAEILCWVRLALVAYFLETTGCTVETIANEMAYPSSTALRNTIKRYTGRRASDIRGGDGLRCVLDALRRRLQSHARPETTLHVV